MENLSKQDEIKKQNLILLIKSMQYRKGIKENTFDELWDKPFQEIQTLYNQLKNNK
jgi:hypothetical protein